MKEVFLKNTHRPNTEWDRIKSAIILTRDGISAYQIFSVHFSMFVPYIYSIIVAQKSLANNSKIFSMIKGALDFNTNSFRMISAAYR